jgi:glycosyltransferase involved in cell wall biosynthesis
VTEIHLVLPSGYDDPHRPSGGNSYDRQVSSGLAGLGWTVVTHEIPDAWPTPDPAVADAVDRQLALIPADRVVVVDGLLGTVAAAALVRQAARLRLVALVHMPGPPGGPPDAVLHAVRLVVTTSQWTARTLVEHHGLPTDKLLVAPPGTTPAELAAGTVTGGVLLCVAAVARPKGHDVLFAALAGLSGRQWTCMCVGALDREPEFVQRQRRFLADSGVADRVELTGPLVGADLERAYAGADVLVLPTRLESYGMVVTEALARGLPVIGTCVGGLPEALGHAADGRPPGILVQPDDARALGAAIADWLDHPKVRDNLRMSARSRRAMLGGWEHPVSTVSAALNRLATT